MKRILYKPEEFKAVCPVCGTVFTYTWEDIEEKKELTIIYSSIGYTEQYVECPTCGHHLKHFYQNSNYQDGGDINKKYLNIPPEVESLPCYLGQKSVGDGCDFYEKMKVGQLYVGDVPCLWCDKGFSKVTCGTATSASSVKADLE